jgi:hypothetical protein
MRFTLLAVAAAISLNAQASPPATRFVEQNLAITSGITTLEQLRTRVKATKVTKTPVRNMHDPSVTDQRATLTAPGLEIIAYVTATGAVFLEAIATTDTSRALPLGLRIGVTTMAAARRAFGNAGEAERGPNGAPAVHYYNEERTASALLWFSRSGTLAGVRWQFDLD